MRTFIFQHILVNPDIDTTIEDSNPYIRQIGTEPLKFMTDLWKIKTKQKRTQEY